MRIKSARKVSVHFLWGNVVVISSIQLFTYFKIEDLINTNVAINLTFQLRFNNIEQKNWHRDTQSTKVISKYIPLKIISKMNKSKVMYSHNLFRVKSSEIVNVFL